MECDSGRLLVVDDDHANRETLYDLLSPRGYEVTLAQDGERALELAQAHDFDVVLLDITMPGIDGFEVLRQLRQYQGRSELPVIMVTGRGEGDHVIRALEGGANDYVTKPLDLPVIVARLRTQLSLKRAYDHIVALEHNQELQNTQLENANKELENAYQQMKGDLRSAAKVQQALLPSSLPEIPGLRFTWSFRPCADLAGDCLNVFQLDDDHVAFYLLDVSGHGVRAALLSVTLSRILTPMAEQPSLLLQRVPGSNRLAPTPPAEVAKELNRRFQLDLETWQYFTLFYGVLNVQTFDLRYVSAGQPGPVYVPYRDAPQNLHLPVFAIGWVPQPNYQERRLQLRPGDRLHLYSDGVDEAMNDRRELFGDQRLVRAIAENSRLPLEEHVTNVLRTAELFAGRPPEDDVSALALEIDPRAVSTDIPQPAITTPETVQV